MVVVGCLFLCSKFAKNCLSAELGYARTRCAVLQHSPDSVAGLWWKRGEMGDGRAGKGEERAGEKEAGGNGEEGVSPSE